MNRRRSEDRLYTAVVLGFLVGLVVLGLLGVPALLVAAIGVAVAALTIGALHRPLAGRDKVARSQKTGQAVPARYVPKVLEGSSVSRRRIGHLRRHRHTSPPLRFR